MTTPPALSIIVVSYNTREMTLDCLRSIAAETRTPHEVILLDNASSDGSADAIAEAFPQVVLIRETTNHGFAQGNNLAIKRARGNYVLLLNPDTIVLDGAIDKLMAFAERTPEARIWGGRTLYGDRSLNPTSCWRRMTLWSLTSQVLGLSSLFRRNAFFNPEGLGGWKRDTEREVDIVTGCFFLIQKSFWDSLGGFDPTYVMYGEEADLCLRARAVGARPRITPTAEIVHYAGASETVRADKLVRLIKAKTTLIRRHFPAWQRPLAMALLRFWPWSRWQAARFRAMLTNSTAQKEKTESWAQVWARRSEWRQGYPKLP
ncbi:glycosyltransferase family 2 protein [Frigidibacter sp. ROC022]|uniref:glycosyltransferase family 2 protein n=1 Tax=Frigidibacter sp. ROC022 TaxID=2971796 RepID=UPI00215A147C|nr:glycosyltransferase family 2 protein [Frigidibacter sp. ROC022]MCR8726787.1 glycosyltransferase family 2 protein [Frigidibacter sp. ROC022]